MALGLAGALVGVMGVRASRDAANLSAKTAIEAQNAQLETDRTTDARDRRRQVYAVFLQASNQYVVATVNFLRALVPKTDSDGFTIGSEDIAAWQSARFSFQGALNDVYVYGTSDSWAAASDLAKLLPPSIGTFDVADTPLTIKDVDVELFVGAYRRVLRLSCIETSPDPGTHCK